MTPDEFLRTIYLGDRACKSLVLDGWKNEVKIQIDSISRVRGEAWDFYTEEDVDDGFLVFEGSITFPSIRPAEFRTTQSVTSKSWVTKAIASR